MKLRERSHSADADDLTWSHPESCPALELGAIHLWLADLKVSASRQRLFESYLDDRELSRANRYNLPDGRKRFTVSRGILKEIVGMYVQRDAAEIRFCVAKHGKPYLDSAQYPPVRFNSTDTGDIALCAVCLSSEVGVDIELRDRRVRHDLVAARKLSGHENQCYLSKTTEDDRRISLLSMWTRKEAYGKAKGVGIRYPLSSISLVGDDEWTRTTIIDPEGLPWEITPIFPTDSILACVVAAGSGWRYRGFRFPVT